MQEVLSTTTRHNVCRVKMSSQVTCTRPNKTQNHSLITPKIINTSQAHWKKRTLTPKSLT